MVAKSILFFTAVSLLPGVALAEKKFCSAGSYLDSNLNCVPCPAGWYRFQWSYDDEPTSCTRCPTGSYQDETGQTTCNPCPKGEYQDLMGQTTCKECPAGRYQNQSGQTSCKQCSEGDYQDQTGQQTCKECPKGQFNNIKGAKKCCKCCSGYYQNDTGKTSCKQCSSPKTSLVGSDSSGDCENPGSGLPARSTSCSMNNGLCPAETPGGPVPSSITRKKRSMKCGRGLKLCPHYSGLGGFDCVDIQNDPESCGGCVDVDGAGNADSGKDCTAIPGVSVVNCVKGGCRIVSCMKAHRISEDGKSCESVRQALSENPRRRRHNPALPFDRS